MKTSVLHTAKAELEAELKQLETQLAPLQERVILKREQLAALERVLEIESGGEGIVRRTPRSNNMTGAAFEILKSSGKPAHYTDLVGRLEEAGVEVPGRQPGANLIAHLSRDNRFIRVGSGIYALSEWGMKAMPKRRRAKRARRG